MSLATTLGQYVNGTTAARLLGGVPPKAVRKLADAGLIRTRAIPHCQARYLVRDILELRKGARPAAPSGAGEDL
jgi:hypothetical protein